MKQKNRELLEVWEERNETHHAREALLSQLDAEEAVVLFLSELAIFLIGVVVGFFLAM